MRTTLVIPDAIYRRAKRAATKQGRTLSEVVSEAVAVQLARGKPDDEEAKTPFKIKPVSMGVPRVDVNDREALARAMEGER